MGLFDGLSGGGPGAEAREKAKMYGELADKLEEKITDLTTNIDTTAEELEGSHASFTSNSDAAQGMINTSFEEHEANWQGQYTRILNNMRMGVQSLVIRKTAARQLETYWDQMARIEEMRANGGF